MRFLLIIACAFGLLQQVPAQTAGSDTVVISNDKLDVTLLKLGGSIISIVLKNDTSKLNPLWQPEQHNFGGYGHFVCVDGFGGTSRDEAKAGLPGHGEAIRTRFDVIGPEVIEGVTTVTFSATLPLVQERIVRTYTLRPGDSALGVRTRLESLVAFDRPISWAEHATIGSPFLERGITAVDQSGTASRTRPYEAQAKGRRTLVSGADFTWPAAPLTSGSEVDLRTAPVSGASMDHTTTAQDAHQSYAWATAINPRLRKVIGWVWKPSDFPWLQNWQNYPQTGVLARGLEFSTQPWDIPRRDAVSINTMLGDPAFRWLPARGAIETVFLIFYSDVPSGVKQVSSLKLDQSTIILNGTVRIAAPPALQQ